MRVGLASVVVGSLLLLASAASADVPLSGTFEASPLRIRVEVERGGPECGARAGSTDEPGGRTEITSDGDQLRFSGAMTGRTDGCFHANPTVRRVSTRVEGGTWSTHCRSLRDDPRREESTYTFRREGTTRLVYREESTSEWNVAGSRCVTRRIAERTFVRNVDGCVPGPPTRIELTPGQKTLEPGARYCFRGRAMDANGCVLPATEVRWSLEHSPGLRAELTAGCFHASGSTAEAEGRYRVIATAGDVRQSAVVVVRAVDLSDLVARRSGGTDGTDEATAEVAEAAQVGVRAHAERTGLFWPSVGAFVAIALITVASVLLLRGRRAAPAHVPEQANPASESGGEPAGPIGARADRTGAAASSSGLRTCPACGAELQGNLRFCPRDGAALVETPDGVAPLSQGMICPTCRRGYPTEARFCPHDATELLPYALFVGQSVASVSPAEKTRICPDCGHRYSNNVTFCGRDGAELVSVN